MKKIFQIKFIKRLIFFWLGIISILIGLVGLVFPVIPGLVFLFLGFICFLEEEKRLRKYGVFKKFLNKNLKKNKIIIKKIKAILF